MGKVEHDLRNELSAIRTGRASLSILDQIRVDYFGTPMQLKELSKLTISDTTTLLVAPWDPSVLPLIEKAILGSDLGLNPANDGKIIRIPIPSLTDDRRKDLVRHLHKVLEAHRTATRNIRRDCNESFKKLLKNKEIAEDEERKALDEVQKVTDQAIARLDDAGKNKEKEILSV